MTDKRWNVIPMQIKADPIVERCLESESTTREFAEHLKERGVVFSVNTDLLSHDELATMIRFDALYKWNRGNVNDKDLMTYINRAQAICEDRVIDPVITLPQKCGVM